MLAHFPSIRCAFRHRGFAPAGGVCPIVSLTAAVSDIAAISPTATSDKVERLGAEFDEAKGCNSGDDSYWHLSAARTDEPDVRNWQMNGRAEEARLGQFVTHVRLDLATI